jgi:hypothetical protein
MPKRLGQIVDTSHSGGRSVQEAWWELLEQNEKYWASGDVGKIRTDKQLIEQMREWFPQRRSRLMQTPSRWRASYNRKRKQIVVYRYVRDSEGRVARATAHALPISQWKRPR